MADDRGNGDRDAAVAALQGLSPLVAASVQVVVLVTRQSDGELSFWQLRPTNDASTALQEVTQAAAAAYADSEALNYQPAGLLSGRQVMWLHIDQVPMLRSIADELTDPAAVPLYEPNQAHLGSIRVAAMRVAADGSSATLLQSLSPGQVVAQVRTRLPLVIRRGVVDVPSRAPVLLFRRDVAAILVKEYVFFNDRRVFERLFGFLEEMQQQATETFQTVTQALRIRGVEQMADVVTRSPAMLGKMASITRKLEAYPQYRAAYTMPKLVAFIRSHPRCEVEVEGEEDDAELIFRNDPQHRFKILKLLDDDYLRSDLTELDYDANSKSAPLV
jgi:Domain of unknown function (DUF4868)